MSFFLNFLLNKFVLLFELTVPLVLFLIMCAIRKKQSAKPIDIEFFDAWPLPSAGFVPLMQGFCDKKNGYRNSEGFYEYPNSTTKELLIQLDKIKHGNYMNPNFFNQIINHQERRSDSNNNKTSDVSPEFLFLKNSIIELHKLNQYFPTDFCSNIALHEHNSTSNDTIKNRNFQNLFSNINNLNSDNGTLFLKNELMKDTGFIGLWLTMQTTFCGSSSQKDSNSTKNSPTNRFNMNDKQLQSIGLILHLIYSNPVILYSPNSTVTTKLMKKSNGTFELLDQISEFAKVWLNKTHLIKSYVGYESKDLIDKINIIDSMTCSWLYLMSGVNLNIFKGFRSEDDLVDYFLNSAYHENKTVFASIVFSNLNENSTILPSNIKYKIRQNASFTQSTKKIRDRYWFPSPRAYNYFYYIFGFVWLQDLIDRAIIDIHSNNTILEPGTFIQQMPYPCYLSDEFLEIIEHVMPLCLAISFVYTVSMLSQQIVYEKELRLKEVMKIMGLFNSAHWLAWFLTYFVQFTVVMSFITLILHFGKILMHSDPLIVFILLLLYAIATICFTFLISVMYTKAKLAAACAGIVYFLSYVPCMYISIREEVAVEVIPKWIKLIASLFSTSAFGLGSKYIAFYEYGGTGIQWSNIDKSPLEDDNFNCLIIVKCMIFDSFLYIILAWYIEQVYPGFGLPRPWYFLFQKSYWFGEDYQSDFTDDNKPRKNSYLFELEPSNFNVGVKLCNVTKIYSNKKLAVDKLSFNFYENQITSFLGVNGAGKSTTMSIITGLMPATRGQVLINGRDLSKNLNEIRSSMGWCPQHNILFDKLTVEEHLWFYAQLKHINKCEIEKIIDNMLNDIDLAKKRKNMVNALSGGMKRKLSVAIAFVGNPTVCLLDEPTAGVDPYSRRAIWDLLIKYKEERTIILSTHHMDEAELLGDRIAIISNGQLKCSGTSLFLKNVLGEGNSLTLVKNHQIISRADDDDDDELLDLDRESRKETKLNETTKLLSFIHRFVPSAYLKMETLREYHFVVPLHERSNQKYWNLFKELEKNKDFLNIDSFGIQDVSLEEIFLKVSEMDSNEDEQLNELDPKKIENLNYIYQDLEVGWRLALKQILAIIKKRYLYNKRNWKSLITQIILPALFICVAMTVALSAPGFTDLPPLELSSSQFYQLTKPTGTFVPFYYKPNKQNNKGDAAYSRDIVDSLRMIVGLGPTCSLNRQNLTMNDVYNSNTSQFNIDYFGENGNCREFYDPNLDIDINNHFIKPKIKQNYAAKDDFYPNCYCLKDYSGFKCETEGTFKHPLEFHTISHETLLNISSSYNESIYYLYTTDSYRLNRYGGLSFDHESRDKSDFDFIRKNLAKVWYNHKAFHAIPTYINVINNAILRANVKHSYPNENLKAESFSITVINHPMNRTNNYLSTEYILQGSDVIISIFTIVAMSFVPASFVLFLVYERSIKSLHLQFLIGLNPLLYWITNFIWDLFNYLLPASCVIVILRLFNVTAYVEQNNFSAVIALFLLYGWSISPLMYPFSYLFNEPSNAYICLIVLNLFTGITCVVSSFLLQIFSIDSSNGLNFVYEFFKQAFLVFPPYCLGRGLIDIAYNDYYNVFYTKTGQFNRVRSPFEWDITARNLVSMACMGALSWIFTLLLEYNCLKPQLWLDRIKDLISSKSNDGFEQLFDSENYSNGNDEDIDVKIERLRVDKSLRQNDLYDHLIVHCLNKVYPQQDHTKSFLTRKTSKGFTAVHNLTFGVAKGDCFGLLGANGAGKTTTFKCLTTDLEQTLGQIYAINSRKEKINSLFNKKNFWKYIGYCPQFDALYDELTPDEHIRLFARIKGVKRRHEDKLVTDLLKRFKLIEFTDKCVGSLSLGNKRKLSTALALVGNPSILLLDEPSSGVDPCSRRHLMSEILNITHIRKQSVIMTSHSMEECEKLCTRISIMVDGRFKCLGSVQHLKNRFGDGYTLTIKIKDNCKAPYESIRIIHQQLVQHICINCKLKERNFNNVYQFDIPVNLATNDKLDIGSLYSLIELNKLRFNIIDYSLSQNTLDNIFINFIKEHTENKSKNVNLTDDYDNSKPKMTFPINDELNVLSENHDLTKLAHRTQFEDDYC